MLKTSILWKICFIWLIDWLIYYIILFWSINRSTNRTLFHFPSFCQLYSHHLGQPNAPTLWFFPDNQPATVNQSSSPCELDSCWCFLWHKQSYGSSRVSLWWRLRQESCQRADLLRIDKRDQSCGSAGPWPVAAVQGTGSGPSLVFSGCVRAEHCCQHILLLLPLCVCVRRCIHNWTPLLIVHCPPETRPDHAVKHSASAFNRRPALQRGITFLCVHELNKGTQTHLSMKLAFKGPVLCSIPSLNVFWQ